MITAGQVDLDFFVEYKQYFLFISLHKMTYNLESQDVSGEAAESKPGSRFRRLEIKL